MKYYYFKNDENALIFNMADSWFKMDGITVQTIPNPFIMDEDIGSNIEEISAEKFDEMIKAASDKRIQFYLKAKDLAKEAHSGQTDKGGNDYYSGHLETVSRNAAKRGVPYGSIVGILHDILEDTSITEEYLRKEFPAEVVDAVVALTKSKNITRKEYLENVKRNPIAREVKICDLENNIDISRIPAPSDKDYKRVLRYVEELQYLLND